MGRNKTAEGSYPLTVRFDHEFISEIDELANELPSSRNIILDKCLEYGLEVFKKERPEIVKRITEKKHYHHEHLEKKRA